MSALTNTPGTATQILAATRRLDIGWALEAWHHHAADGQQNTRLRSDMGTLIYAAQSDDEVSVYVNKAKEELLLVSLDGWVVALDLDEDDQ